MNPHAGKVQWWTLVVRHRDGLWDAYYNLQAGGVQDLEQANRDRGSYAFRHFEQPHHYTEYEFKLLRDELVNKTQADLVQIGSVGFSFDGWRENSFYHGKDGTGYTEGLVGMSRYVLLRAGYKHQLPDGVELCINDGIYRVLRWEEINWGGLDLMREAKVHG